MNEKSIKSLTDKGEIVLEITFKEFYAFPKHAINNWSIDQIIQDWFLDHSINQSHATREAYKIGYSKEIVNIKAHSKNKEDYEIKEDLLKEK